LADHGESAIGRIPDCREKAGIVIERDEGCIGRVALRRIVA
jgi:hypothetical protein